MSGKVRGGRAYFRNVSRGEGGVGEGGGQDKQIERREVKQVAIKARWTEV